MAAGSSRHTRPRRIASERFATFTDPQHRKLSGALAVDARWIIVQSEGPGLGSEFVVRLPVGVPVEPLLVGALPTWPYSGGWGYYPSGGLGLVLLIVLILLVMDRI